MKYFVFSDVHGDYNALMTAINNSKYDPLKEDHQLISCGDMFGRAEKGLGSLGIYNYLTSDKHTNKPICIFGNHEDILLNILKRGSVQYIDILNGEDKTIDSFSRTVNTPIYVDDGFEKIDYIVKETQFESFLKSLPFYYETENFLFIHGWLPDNFRDAGKSEWVESSWAHTKNIIRMLYSNLKKKPTEKTIVFGHWHAADLYETFYNSNCGDHIWLENDLKLIGLDCCTARSGRIEILEIDD